jgi:hypothetical protein
VHRSVALALVVVALSACHNTSRGGVDQPGAPTAQLAIERFMTAAKSQDLHSLSLAWGTTRGPARDVVDKSQIEKRELILVCYLNHDSYRVKSEALAAEGKRAFVVELQRGPIARSTTMTTVKGPADRYFVESVVLEPLADLCASGGNVVRQP